MAFATHRMILKVRYLLTNLIINNYLILSFFIKIQQYSQDIILYSHLMILHIKNTLLLSSKHGLTKHFLN